MEGAGKAGCKASTHGPPAEKKAGGSHHRYGRTTGLPCAAVYGLYVVSPGTGVLAPVTCELVASQT